MVIPPIHLDTVSIIKSALGIRGPYLIDFWGQNLNLSESLEGVIVRLSEQSDRLTPFPQPANYLAE